MVLSLNSGLYCIENILCHGYARFFGGGLPAFFRALWHPQADVVRLVLHVLDGGLFLCFGVLVAHFVTPSVVGFIIHPFVYFRYIPFCTKIVRKVCLFGRLAYMSAI